MHQSIGNFKDSTVNRGNMTTTMGDDKSYSMNKNKIFSGF